ncbi:MAG: MlaD family protein [Bacteroidota bacterium]
MLRLTSIIVLLIFAVACSGDSTYFLETNDAYGLEEGDKVYRQGVEVGEVQSVGFEGDMVRIKIASESPLFEGQAFGIDRDRDGVNRLELGAPPSDAKQLAAGETLKRENPLEDVFEDLGKSMEGIFEEAFGKDGEKLDELGEKFSDLLETNVEGIAKWGKEMEAWGEEMEAWAKENEEELERLGNNMERWAEEHEADFEDWGRELERISEKYEAGSEEWRRELRKSLERFKDQE